MTESTTQARPAVTTASLLGIVFIVLKLTGVIAWSWVWVLSPFWIPLALAVFFGAVLVVLALVTSKETK